MFVVKIVHEANSFVLYLQYEASYGTNQLSNTTILENQNINHGVKFFKHFRQFSDTFLMKEPDPIPDPFDETHVAVHTLKKVVKS